jgi:hypothetical protein
VKTAGFFFPESCHLRRDCIRSLYFDGGKFGRVHDGCVGVSVE